MKKLLMLSILVASGAWGANSSPASFSYQGRLFKSDGVTPVDSATVNFTVQIRSPNGSCLLYEETHFRNMSNTDGTFTLIVGEGNNTNASLLNIVNVFENSTAKVGASSCAYSPVAGDIRRLRLTYDDGQETVTLAPDQSIRSVPYALMAGSLDGLDKSKFIQVSSYTSQAKVDLVMNSYAAVMDLVNGTNSTYAKAADSASKTYVDSRLGGQVLDISGTVNGSTIVYNSSTSKWEAKAPTSSIASLNVSAPLQSTGGTSPTLSISVGTTAGTVAAGNDPRISGALQTSTPASGDLSGTLGSSTVSKIRGVAVAATAPSNGQVLKYNSSSSQWEPAADDSGLGGILTGITASGPLSVTGTVTPQISIQNGSSVGQSLRWNGSAWTVAFQSFTDLRGVAFSQQFPTNCSTGQTWAYQSMTDTFACTNISISASQISGLGGAANLSIGTTAGTVAAGNDSRITGALQSSGSAGGDLGGTFGNPTVTKIRGVDVANSAPVNGQVLKYNSMTSQWEPSTDVSNSGTVTSVTSGTGLVAGTITNSGTISVDVGTTANKIVQLDSSGRLPAVDGSRLTNVSVSSIPFKSVVVISTAGSFNWTPPAGVEKVYVEVWGAGGGGSGGKSNSSGGLGGGAGSYGAWFQTVTPGVAVTGTIGPGGTGGTANSAGNAGGATTFDITTVNGGGGATTIAVGVGGAAPGGTSVVGMGGGNGNFGSIQTVQTSFLTVVGIQVLGTIDYAGLGGSGGAAVRGGVGGNGSGNNSAGGNGIAPGGGGGGGGSAVGGSGSTGGAGANGRVTIWY